MYNSDFFHTWLFKFRSKKNPDHNGFLTNVVAAVVVHSVKAFALQVEGWVFEYQLRETQIVKTGSDNFTGKRSAKRVSVPGPRRWPFYTDDPKICHAKEPSMLHGDELRVYIKICSPSTVLVTFPYEWKILDWNLNSNKETDLQTNKYKTNLRRN